MQSSEREASADQLTLVVQDFAGCRWEIREFCILCPHCCHIPGLSATYPCPRCDPEKRVHWKELPDFLKMAAIEYHMELPGCELRGMKIS